MKRVIWIVLDSVGMGMLPDAKEFGDEGANTLGHIFQKYPDIAIPNMINLGLANIEGMIGIDKIENPNGCYGRAKEISMGKDTTIGHWEMVGIHTKKPLPTYLEGFPEEIINAFIKETNCGGVLGNKVASGTQIIEELGDYHMATGFPIVYTSSDSVFQIAASEDIIPAPKLYEICEKARHILVGEHAVARVIARPFTKTKNGYERTSNRRDFSLKPDENNLLVKLKDNNIEVAAVGKIADIFDGEGISQSVHTKSNMDGVDKTLEYMDTVKEGLIFTNLVDFDMKWGHRRDVLGYKDGLEEFDKRLNEIIDNMEEDDVLIINADHGCDPTYKGTDHTREYIPVLAYGKQLKSNVDLKTLNSFADIGATIADYLGVDKLKCGESFIDKIF